MFNLYAIIYTYMRMSTIILFMYQLLSPVTGFISVHLVCICHTHVHFYFTFVSCVCNPMYICVHLRQTDAIKRPLGEAHITVRVIIYTLTHRWEWIWVKLVI